jgi:hypothetical protein
MANVGRSSVGTSVGTSDMGPLGGLLVLGILGLVGYYLFTAFLAPGFAVAVQLYTAAVSVPATFAEQQWMNLAWDALWGVLAGFLIGLIRLWRRSEVLEQLVDSAASADTVTAARIGFWGLTVHALVGALSGAIVGLLGLISPLQAFDGSTSFLADHAFLPAISLLTGAGFFNAGGAPPGAGDIHFNLFILVLLIVLATMVVSALATTGLAWWANVLASGAARGAGSAVGSSLLVALTGLLTNATRRRKLYPDTRPGQAPPLSPFRKGWFGAALAAGVLAGMWTGLVNALVVVACLYLVRDQVVSTLGPPPTLTEWPPFAGHPIPGGHEVVFRPDGQALLAAGPQVTCWDLQTAQELWRSSSGASALAFSPDGQVLAAINTYDRFELLDPTNGNPITTASDWTSSITGIAFLSDGHTVVSRDSKDCLQLRDALGEAAPRTLPSPLPGLLERMAVASRAAVVAAAVEHRVVVWDTDSGRVLSTLAHDATVLSLTVSPDGRTVAVGDGRWIKVWDTATGRLVRTLAGHTENVAAVAFSPDGKLLASAGAGQEVRLWDAATGRGLSSTTGHTSGINGLVFSPDSKLLATVGSDTVVWSVR